MADRNLRMQLILEGLDRITAPLKSITNASSNARRDLAETQKQLKALDALQKQVGGYKAAEGRFASDHQQLQQTQARVAQLRHELEATEAPTKKLRTEFEKAQRQASMLTDRVDAGGKELQQLQRQLEAAGIDVSDLAAHEDRLSSRVYDANKALKQQIGTVEKLNQANRNTQKLNDISAKATGAGLGMIAAGTAAGLPVVAATKQAMTLESAMADVSKVTNMTRPQIEQMSTDFLDMSETIPVPAEGLAQIAAAAGAAGVGMDKMGRPMADQRQQLQEFTADAAKMGVAFDMTADVAGETMATWRTAFELPQEGVRALGDRVNALTNTFGGKAANVTDIITRIGPLGKVAGLAAPQVAALGSTLDSIGVPSEVAATGIKNTMLALTKGEAATKSQQGAFKALGLSATDVAKRMQTDAAGAIVDVMTRIGKLDAGPLDSICDVGDISVGHCTLDDGALQTGVTVLRPHGGNPFLDKVPAAATVLNGFGKSTGLVQVQELGVLETPIAERAAFREMFDMHRPLRKLDGALSTGGEKAVMNAQAFADEVLRLASTSATQPPAYGSQRDFQALETAA